MSNNTQIKYKNAILWCDAHRSMLPARCGFRRMSTENLYILMEAFGARWNAQDKVWNTARSEQTPITEIGKQGDWRSAGHPSRCLIRIIAHKVLIEKRVQEFTELCEALNWRVVKIGSANSEPDRNFMRCYITIEVEE